MKSVVAISVAAMILAGCSVEAEMAVAENGVAEFRQMMASRRYGEIFSARAEDSRQPGSGSSAVPYLEHVADRLGPVRNSTRQSWRVTTGRNGAMVTLGYATEFARGRGTENFVFRVSDGSARLVRYHVNAPALNPPPAELAMPRAQRTSDNSVAPAAPVRR
jgi:hypothetical protein